MNRVEAGQLDGPVDFRQRKDYLLRAKASSCKHFELNRT